ncbi:60S ribosomal protein L28 [Stachybotrys elegans]|uniref:60S ribosomal protein L28 n=1 Tax=Stachybotrys elegans TaxID=80388 RepID=A0A8K0WM53_9HYPO|nr:60S ribosomal protein L28 [Stachybotrys elegans]
MATATLPNISADLVWEIVRENNSFLVKSKRNGGVQFSRDPLNLTSLSSRKHAGFVNEKAIGVVPNEKGGVTVISKKAEAAQKPASNLVKVTHGGNKSSRKTYKTVANQAAKSGYRADLRSAAVERASAIRRSQRPVKPTPEPKLRGNKAKKAAEEA